MPESRIRRRRAWTAPPTRTSGPGPSPRWWVPVMLGLMVIGLAWVVVFYLSGQTLPVPHWKNWNLLVGFGFILVGFAMTTRWR